MSKKAEEAALKAYPELAAEWMKVKTLQPMKRAIYKQGYKQAIEDVLIEIGRRDFDIPRRYFSKPSDYTLYTNRAKVEAYGELKACIESWIKSTDERESVSGEN